MYITTRRIRNSLQQLEKKLSISAIAENEKMSRLTVSKIRRLADNTNISLKELLVLNDSELENKLGLQAVRKISNTKKPIPDWNFIKQELKRPNMTLMLLWNEYRIQCPEGLGYSRFCELFQKFNKSESPSKYLIHTGGDTIQVDFCGTTVPIINAQTGEEEFNAQIFVAVLPASGYIFVFAVKSQKIRDWQLCLIEMYDFFGGVSQKIIPDNLKSAILSNNKNGTVVTPAFAELASHYNTIVLPARPRQPQDKSLAEISVNIVQRRILAKYRDFKFFSLAQLNKVLKDEIKIINEEPTQTYPIGRFKSYLEIDLPYLQPLPQQQFELSEWFYDKKVTVTYTVNILDFDYSVPYSYIHLNVDVRVTDTLVEIFYKRSSIAVHQRIYKGASISYDHMPPNHKLHEDLQPYSLVEWAGSMGENTLFVIEHILDNKPNYANNLRKLNKLKTTLMDKNESRENIELAFGHIRKINSYTLTSIESVFKTKSYLLSKNKSIQTVNSPKNIISHQNIRGADYYQNGGLNANYNSL